LLVVITVIGILAALLFPALKPVVNKADRARGAAIMGGIGKAIFLYTVDHDGYLPGPLTPGVGVVRGAGEAGLGQTLVNRIAGYAGGKTYQEGEIVKEFANPAVLKRSGTNSLAHYYLYLNLRDTKGNWTGPCPWGYPQHATWPQPLKVMRIENPASQIVMKDSDKKLVNTDRPPGWPSPGGLDNPVYWDSRNVLFFDGHIEIEQVSPTTP